MRTLDGIFEDPCHFRAPPHSCSVLSLKGLGYMNSGNGEIRAALLQGLFLKDLYLLMEHCTCKQSQKSVKTQQVCVSGTNTYLHLS